jgi:NTE family protein
MAGLILALGGGGARGLAHVGVLKVLHREGLAVAAVAGSSMGGLIGAMYAAGIPPVEIERDVLRLGTLKEMIRLVDIGVRWSGLAMRGDKIAEFLAERIGRDLRIEELRLPFAAVAADLRSGREVVLDRGRVLDAVRATISIPGVFVPVERDGMLLVDGGILDNLPVRVARRLSGGPVVAIDVLPSLEGNRPGQPPLAEPIRNPHLPGLLNDTVQAQLIMVSAMTACALEAHPADLVVRPQLPADISVVAGFGRAEESIAAGVDAATKHLSELRRLADGPVDEGAAS